jgi:hypothetical protein
VLPWLVVSLMTVRLMLALPLLPLIPMGRPTLVWCRMLVALLKILGPLALLNPVVLLTFLWSVIRLMSLGPELLLRRPVS